MRTHIILFVILLSPVVKLFSNQIEFPEIEGFQKVPLEEIYVPDNLFDLINGGADVYLDYNFVDLHLCDYKIDDIVITVEAYNHGDISNAFGIYATERSSDYHFVDIGTEGYQEDGILNFFQDNFYIKLYGYSESGKSVNEHLLSIAEKVSASVGDDKSFPELLNRFPIKDKVLYSEKFINNSFMGYSYFKNVYSADYKMGEHVFTFFVMSTETNEKAREIVEEFLHKQDIEMDGSEKIFEIDDEYTGKIFLSTYENIVLGTTKCEDQKVFKEIMDSYTK